MISDKSRARLIRLWEGTDLSYCDDEIKKEAHRIAKRLLTDFARHSLRLPDDKFSVRSNPAGIAVSGEVTLHTEPLPGLPLGIYVQIGQSSLGRGHTILYRTCKHRADYTGGQNNWSGLQAFASTDSTNAFANQITNICKRGT